MYGIQHTFWMSLQGTVSFVCGFGETNFEWLTHRSSGLEYTTYFLLEVSTYTCFMNYNE
jgi:hypothetical protein